MGTDAINKSSGSTQVYQTQPSFGSDVSLMSPDALIMFMQRALGDIGEQLQQFKDVVTQRQEKAKDLRDIAAAIRDMQANADSDGALTAYDQSKYCELMNKMEKYKSDPAIGQAYETFLSSYGGYYQEDGKTITGVMAGAKSDDNQDMKLSSTELANALKKIEGAQENLNSENELTMMQVQQLASKRNETTQLCSNLLKSFNESAMTPIRNIG